MITRTLSEEIKWYRSAVKSSLILKARIQEEEADRALANFMFDEKMKRDPEFGLHYEPSELADEIIRLSPQILG